jgi:hypothetical protein
MVSNTGSTGGSGAASSTDFNVAVPQDELDAKPNFLMEPGWYHTTIQGGAQVVSNDNGWAGVRVPFSGFASKRDPAKTYEKDRNYQITTGSSNAQAKSIGAKQAVELAAAFGLAEETKVDGKPAKRLTATGRTPEEFWTNFVEQLNAVAGSPCDVYVVTKKRKRDGVVVMRDDNTGPVMDNEISRVAAYGEGK